MILWKTWRELRWMAFAYLLILEILIAAAVYYWPTLATEIQRSNLDRLIPGDFLQRALRVIKNDSPEIAYPAYIALQQFFKGCNIAGIACAILLGTGTIAGERENGTIEFLFSRPIPRGRILLAKVAVMSACVVVPVFLSSVSVIPLSRTIDLDVIPMERLLMASCHSSIFVLDFLMLTVLFSTLCHAQVHVAFAVGGFVIVQVGMYFVQVLRTGSVFHLADFDVFGPILAGHVGWLRLFLDKQVWMLVAGAALYAAAHLILRRKDI